MRYRFGLFELRAETRELLREGEPVPVGGRAFDLLLALLQRRDRVVSSAELYKDVWPGVSVQPNNLQVQIWSLRNLLGAHTIVTVARRGYRFVGTVEVSAETTGGGGADHRVEPIELALAGDLLKRHRVVTLVGSDERTLRDFSARLGPALLGSVRDGVWGFESDRLLAALDGPAGLPNAVAAVLRRLSQSSAIFIFHNCHRAPDVARRAVQDSLGRVARLRVLATSLERLGLPDEGVVPLPRAWPLAAAASAPSDAVGLRWRARPG